MWGDSMSRELAAISDALTAGADPMVPVNFYETVDFRSVINQQQSKADNVLSRLSAAFSSGVLGDKLIKSQKKETRYVVNMSEELSKAIDEGLVKLDTSKKGEIFAQLRDANGHFSDKLSITKEVAKVGLNPTEISQALQMKAIEEKLGQMLDMLDEIGRDVADVIQGQQNDRIGLYNSGLTLYLESRSIQDATFRSLVSAQALKTLSDGNEQILQDLRTNMQYLLEGKYKAKKGHSAEDIREKMANINRCFDIVHRSYLLKAALFYERAEITAMLSVFDEYGKFLQREIMPYAPQLTELDRNDVLLQDGRWERRAKLFDELGTIRLQLTENHVYSLGTEAVTGGEG